MDDIRYCAPDAEVIILGYWEAGVVRIGRDEPSLVALFDKVLESELSIEFAYGYLFWRRIAVALVNYHDVAAEYPGIDHRVSVDADEIRRLRMRAEHREYINVLRALIIVQWHRETGHNSLIKEGE